MDKNLIIKLLQKGKASSADQAKEVIELKSQYPYSQVLHVLAAKLSKDEGLSIHQQELQLAAIYSSDRAVLKDIMTSGFIDGKNADIQPETIASQQNENIVRIVKEQVIEDRVKDPILSLDVADMVLNDLEKLNTSRHNFEMLFADHSTVSIPVTKENNADTESVASSKSKKEKIIELAKAAAEKNEETAIPQPVVKRKKRENVTEKLIEEIKISKEELEPESEKQKEQIEIIDHFIKKQPTIANPANRSTAAPEDLDNIKSGEFGENIVSETLVEILIKQGKKERAIEVLKKLIWKYPQKKAYFASQIEDLKK